MESAEAGLELEKEQQGALRRLLEIVLAGSSLQETLEQCLHSVLAISWLRLQHKGGIFLADTPGGDLRLAVSMNLSPEVESLCARVPLGHCLCGRAAASGEVQFADCLDERHEIRYAGIAAHGHYNLPIKHGDTVLGVMVLYLPPGCVRNAVHENFLVSVVDILAGYLIRHEAEATLKESEARHRLIVETAAEGFWMVDREGKTIQVNSALCRMLGYTAQEMLGRHPLDFVDGPQRAHFLAQMQRISETQYRFYEVRLRHRDGHNIPLYFQATTHFDDKGQILLSFAFVTDLTERKDLEAELKRQRDRVEELAYFDSLTGLPNRRLFMDRLGQALAGSHRNQEYAALLMIGLDHFKDLNDTLGHEVGDVLLKQVAERLTGRLRQRDSIARFGGDEFVVIAEGLGKNESQASLVAERIAETVRGTLDQSYSLVEGQPPYHGTSSIGITLFLGRENGIDTLLRQADLALNQAKIAGRNLIRFFNPDMQAAINARTHMLNALRGSLARNELQLHYQPQVDDQGRRIGAEALLRWPGRDGTVVSPAEFIPLAEETGLILPMGAWVLSVACAQLRSWADKPETRGLTLSINVSARQFHQTDFVERVREEIQHSGINPQRLKLELTESVVIDHLEQVVQRMHALKALGVGFSLDDFGTGFSSLSYLKRLPLDQVKIDRSFVRDIADDANDAAIVRAIIAMSQSLGLEVMAEGVETQTQRDMLAAFGCRHFQGYLFGRPAPIEAWDADASRA